MKSSQAYPIAVCIFLCFHAVAWGQSAGANHSGGSTLYTLNQQAGGGTWNRLGSHWLLAGQTFTVILDDAETSGFVVIADAARWTKAP